MQHDMIDMNAPYDPAAAEEGATASAGSPLAEGEDKASKDAMIEALRTVFDPEIPVNLYDLGLIYDIDQRENGDVGILMTLDHAGLSGRRPDAGPGRPDRRQCRRRRHRPGHPDVEPALDPGADDRGRPHDPGLLSPRGLEKRVRETS